MSSDQFQGNVGPEGTREGRAVASGGSIVAWCMRHVTHGRRVRDMKYAHRWKEYTRLWRGFYSHEDQTTAGERSQLISPALQQAIEMTVSEIEEAVFGREAWFDITDDIADEERDDAIQLRDQLLEDFSENNMEAALSEVFLLGSIYGTGILKLNVGTRREVTFVNGSPKVIQRVAVTGHPVRPDEFVIDPSALSVQDALYVAHEMIRPLHTIKEKQAAGKYRQGEVGPYTGQKSDTDGTGKKAHIEADDQGVLITEYFGKVPRRFMPGAKGNESGMVEAIVTIANERVLLRAAENPFLMQDRPILAYQHETVPGEFWGRGVAEKGYNPAKALNAEMRARADALALITAPMMGADITKIPRNSDTTVRPGRTVFTRGRPSEVYEPLLLAHPQILAHTFQQSSDLERMVQMGTGAMDSAAPLHTNRRNETSSGMSQMQSGFIKRSKRTMKNLERQLLNPLVQKSLWRYIQLDPMRYPQDMKFRVKATMGIMAREVENAQLTNMLGFLTPDDPARQVVIQAIFENTASANKDALKKAIEIMSRPPSEEEIQEQQMLKQLQMRATRAEVALAEAKAQRELAEIQKKIAETKLTEEKARHERIEADLEDELVDIQAMNAVSAAEKAKATRQQSAAAAVNALRDGASKSDNS